MTAALLALLLLLSPGFAGAESKGEYYLLIDSKLDALETALSAGDAAFVEIRAAVYQTAKCLASIRE